MPEGEVGPYFVDDSAPGLNRSDIRSNLDGTGTQLGIPLRLVVKVLDTTSGCRGLDRAQIDIWHCNAMGVYSSESFEDTAGDTWLRGFQLTNAAGEVAFTTIVPGWYPGRTTHIHLRIRSKYGSAADPHDGSNTVQLFFPQAALETITDSTAPYNSRGRNSTTNDSDHVYAEETHAKSEMSLHGNAIGGYVATVAIGVPIAHHEHKPRPEQLSMRDALSLEA